MDVFIVFEYLPTDLHAVIKCGILCQSQIAYITHQLLEAVYFLHSGQIIHRCAIASSLSLFEVYLRPLLDLFSASKWTSSEQGYQTQQRPAELCV